ncbi:MAG: diaminopimelate decarboxylase [Candidatus Korobacteraceae bacterium]
MKADHPQERPPGFTYRREKRSFELHADAIPLAKLAHRYGTPLYVYSASTVRERYRSFDQAFAKCEHTICYSVKANSNLSVLRMLAGMGASFDIVSGGELQRVLAVSRKSAAKVVFSGVGKLADELDQALHAGILMFNVESPSELKLLAARAAHLRKSAPFAIRVNPHVAAKTHPYVSTGMHQHKFGVPWRDAAELYRLGAQESWLRAVGVSVHIGSQITDVDPFHETMQRVATLVRSLREDGHDIRYLDGGGGLGIFYQDRPQVKFAAQTKQYAKALTTPLKSLGIHLLLEPGRAIIGPAGVLLTRVIYRKRNDGKQFVVVDAAMNDLLRPSLYNAYHEIVPVVLTKGEKRGETVDVVGPVCETGDFLAHDRALPRVEEGDLLAVLDTGAYGMSLASNYNSRPRPAEVLVEGNRSRLARKRESIGDLLALERS